MSVADFFDLRVTLKNMIDDELGTIRQQIDAINMLINDLEVRVNINRDEIVNLRNEFNIFQTNTNNAITNLTTRVTTLETNFNTFVADVNRRLSDMDQNLLYLRQQLQGQIDAINAELARTIKKAQPIPGYNPYNLGGNVTAQVWLYDITPVDDGDIRMYYIQFNNISGPIANTTNWMPLPRAFQKYVYALHSDFFATTDWQFTIPNLFGSTGANTYRIEFNSARDSLLLRFYAGPIPNIVGDYVAAIIIANGIPSEMSDADIDKMKHEDLIKLTKELTFKVKQLDKPKENIDKNKVIKDITEQMKKMANYEFIEIGSIQPKMTQSTTKK
jgi:hypothetical protein